MQKKFAHIFDIDELGKELGGKLVEYDGPGPAHGSLQVVWTPALAVKLHDRIKSIMAGNYDVEVCHRGSAPMWVMVTAVSAMYPASITYTPPAAGVELKIHNTSRGPLVPEAEIEFTTRREGNNVFISYKADDPDKPQLYGGGHHSYNPDLLPLVKAPEVGPDDHVFLAADSSYNVRVTVSSAYFTGCKSFSIMAAGFSGPENEYVCCVSHCDEISVGDVTPA